MHKSVLCHILIEVAKGILSFTIVFTTFPISGPWVNSLTLGNFNWVIIGSGNGLPPVWRQPINWTNADFFSIGPVGISFIPILFEIQTFSFKEIQLKMSFAILHQKCLGLNVLSFQGSLFVHLASSLRFIAYQEESIPFSKWQSQTNKNLGKWLAYLHDLLKRIKFTLFFYF